MDTKTLAEKYNPILERIKQSPQYFDFGGFHFIEKAAELNQDYFWQLLIGYSELLDFEEARPLIEEAHKHANRGIKYYQSGVLKENREYKNGKLHGISRFYDHNGIIQCDVMYKDGMVHGFYNKYHETGVLCERYAYENDKHICMVGKYNRKGKPIKLYHGYGQRLASTIADIASPTPANIPVYVFNPDVQLSVHFIILNKSETMSYGLCVASTSPTHPVGDIFKIGDLGACQMTGIPLSQFPIWDVFLFRFLVQDMR